MKVQLYEVTGKIEESKQVPGTHSRKTWKVPASGFEEAYKIFKEAQDPKEIMSIERMNETVLVPDNYPGDSV
jgi:hypothetical protein